MARKYTDAEKSKVYVTLTAHQGNVKRTARELNMPITTVRQWRDMWRKDGVPEEVAELAAEDAETFVADASRARDLALSKWEQKVRDEDISARDLMTGVGVLTDKINVVRGLTKGGESRPELPPGALREIAEGLVKGAIESAKVREAEIIEAEYEVVEPREITQGASSSDHSPNDGG